MRKILTLFILFSVFIFGVTFGHYKYYPFELLRDLKQSLTNDLDLKPKNFQSCSLPITLNLKENSHLFIGHGYGSPITADHEGFIDPNVFNLIKKYGDKFKSITFTGDVFSVPALSKWEKLESLKVSNQDIFVSPGNHDIRRPDSRDIFKLSPFGKKAYPFVNTIHGFPVVIDDSESSNWSLSNKTISMINQLENDTIFVARHNMPISDLVDFANSKPDNLSSLVNVENFVLDFSENVNYFWIIGDSGAWKELPRLSCMKYKNHSFILNGIGGVEGDSVIIFNRGQLYQYIL